MAESNITYPITEEMSADPGFLYEVVMSDGVPHIVPEHSCSGARLPTPHEQEKQGTQLFGFHLQQQTGNGE